MDGIIIDIINSFGYVGILLLIAAENLFPPIPSEVILTFGGFVTTYSNLNIWLVILFSTLGSVLGAGLLYLLGRVLNEQRLEHWLSGRWGKILHLKASDIKRADSWFRRKGNITVFFCRFIPIVRSLISIPAGISKMNFYSFLALTTAGTLIWNSVLVWLGAIAGASWERIVGYVGIYSAVVIVILLFCAIIFGVYFYKKRIKKK